MSWLVNRPLRAPVNVPAWAFIFILPLIFACQTAPKSEPTVRGEVGSAEGQWQGKARVRHLRTGKENIISLDAIAREPSQLRLEVTGPFSVHLASIVLNGDEVRYILTREKRFVSTSATSAAFVRLIPIRISPTALLAVLFDRELPAAEWKCVRDPATRLLSTCAHLYQDVQLKWLERTGLKRRLAVLAQDAEVEMVLDEAKSKVELNEKTFELMPPRGFKQEKLTRRELLMKKRNVAM